MTTEELVPVLKALLNDKTCWPIMADWFEERGDDVTAAFLRKAPDCVLHGDTLIRILQRPEYPSCGAIWKAVCAADLPCRASFSEAVWHYQNEKLSRHGETEPRAQV